MKKIFLVTMIAMLTLVGKAHSEMTYGWSLALTKIDATGTETEGGETTNGDADNLAVIPSIFAEYGYSDTISLGLDYIPLEADVSSKTKTRNDTETSVSGTAATVSTARTNKAQATLKNHLTLYANYNLNDSTYVKVGAAMVTLQTDDSLGTGSKYPNEDIYAGVIGLGMQEGNHRFELVYTDYEDITLTSTVQRTGVATRNKIDAELDTLAFKYAYAF